MRLDTPAPGTVAVAADEAGRYTQFAISMQGLQTPPGTRTMWQIGNDIAGNRNRACEQLAGDWLWFIDDDHAFPNDILLRLLARNVDIVTPLCLRRSQPFLPVACVNDDFMDLADHGANDLVSVQHAGSSGMLIRRRVLEQIEPPWFELGNGVSEDVNFCRKAHAAGFDIHVDTGVQLGHITTAVVWPHYEQEWRTGITVADGFKIQLPRLRPLRVTACLAWWDEPPEMLEELVASLAGLTDRIVAVDGAYAQVEVDGDGFQSPRAQWDALEQSCDTAGIELEIHAPDRRWAGQVEKRDYLMRTAAEGSDWLLVVDADYRLVGDGEAVRRELAGRAEDALTVAFSTPTPDAGLSDELVASEWHERHADKVTRLPLLFRALPGFRVENEHWLYSAEKDGRRVALWGDDGRYPAAATGDLGADLVVEHRCFFRPQATINRNRVYIQERDRILAATGVEP